MRVRVSRRPAAASCASSHVMPLLPELRLNASSKAADLRVQARLGLGFGLGLAFGVGSGLGSGLG